MQVYLFIAVNNEDNEANIEWWSLTQISWRKLM